MRPSHRWPVDTIIDQIKAEFGFESFNLCKVKGYASEFPNTAGPHRHVAPELLRVPPTANEQGETAQAPICLDVWGQLSLQQRSDNNLTFNVTRNPTPQTLLDPARVGRSD